MSYALEKFNLAIYDLTVGEDDVKWRLQRAFRHLNAVSERDFPEELKDDWQSIINRLTKRESDWKGTQFDEGSFKATMFRMHKKTAAKIVVDIVELQDRLDGYVKDGFIAPI
jgi:hypothetical protein